MSFEAKVSIAGKDARVLHCSYSLNRDVDATGRPSSKVYGGKITLEIEGTDDHSIFEWMVDQYQTKDGTITFNKRDSNSKMKEIKWEKGYCVAFSESYDSTGANPLTMTFTISAEKISVDGASHTNPWPKS